MDEIQTLERGDQIVYIPDHLAELNYRKPKNWKYPNGLQPGFVMAVNWKQQVAYCRYWLLDHDDVIRVPWMPELRTKANSEATPIANLVKFNSVFDKWVQKMIEWVLENS